MRDWLNCEICFDRFSVNKVPRIFRCGHSCCSSCLKRLIETGKRCHICRQWLQGSLLSQYPVMYALLEACDDVANFSLRSRLLKFSKTHEDIITTATSFIGYIPTTDITEQVEKMKMNKEILEDLISKEEKELDNEGVTETIENFKKKMNEVQAWLNNRATFENQMYLTDKCFATSKEFLQKYDEVKSAFLKCELKIFFAFASKCRNNHQKIFIDLQTDVALAFTFLKLCTGESGFTYLRCPYINSFEPPLERLHEPSCVREQILRVNWCHPFHLGKRAIQYLKKNQQEKNFVESKYKYFVELDKSGSFEIFKSVESSVYVVGTVVNPDDFLNLKLSNADTANKVFDCGIAARV